jgi:hypothetical protein
MCKWYMYVVPRESGPVKKGVSTCPRSSQVVNRSRVGKCSNHYQLIMKVGRMKNCSVCIMYALQPLSLVLYTRGCAMENPQFDSKHPVIMNSIFLSTIPPSVRSVIKSRCFAPILFVKSGSCIVLNFSCKPRLIKFFALDLCWIHRVQDKYWCAMATSQNIRRGAKSCRITRPEPQSDWDLFLLTTVIPKDPKGLSPLPAEMMISRSTKPGMEGLAQEGRTLDSLSPQQEIPRRRGRPRKNNEARETRVPNEPHARSVAKELLMHAIRLEHVEGTS